MLCPSLGQTEALAFGKMPKQLKGEGAPDCPVPHRACQSNRPYNMILAERFTPEKLDKLGALYK
jgi:glucose-6-phosphate isomerase